MSMTSEKQQQYEKYVKQITPTHSLGLNMLKAFLTGGLICMFGQLILHYAYSLGLDRESAASWCSLILILISVLLTGLNLYSKSAGLQVPEALFPSPASPILLQPQLLNTRWKAMYSESAVKYLPLPGL